MNWGGSDFYKNVQVCKFHSTLTSLIGGAKMGLGFVIGSTYR
jgi:hypothetical protein